MKALVTGGGGFLGTALVRELLAHGHEAIAAGRHDYPEVAALGARCVRLDVCDREALTAAARGCDVVFHAAAKAGVWGDPAEYWRTNLGGTESALHACRQAGVPRLVYTSSPSVVFDDADHEGARGDLPYPLRYEAVYPETKAAAERRVRAAAGPELATVCLRPHLIYGPADPHLLPRLFERARRGRLRIVGPGHNKVSVTYVDNAARAHRLAAERLEPGAAFSGEAFFVNDAEPVVLWEWLGELIERVGLSRPTRRVGRGLARAAGGLAEAVWRTLRLDGEPPMTRFVAAQLARSHWYDPAEAEAAFGYRAPVTREEALERTAAWWRPRLAA